MTKENPSNYKTLQIWIKKGIVCILIFKNVVIALRICTTLQTFIYAGVHWINTRKRVAAFAKRSSGSYS